jgi:amphi-Trp domain-containing protein
MFLLVDYGVLRYTERQSRWRQKPMAKKDEKWQAKQARKAARRQHRRKAQAVLSRPEMAERLRVLAAQVEAGAFALGDTELELLPYADFEISYKLKKRGSHQIEIEIEWGGPSDAPLLQPE